MFQPIVMAVMASVSGALGQDRVAHPATLGMAILSTGLFCS
jgi:hypothetical protein